MSTIEEAPTKNPLTDSLPPTTLPSTNQLQNPQTSNNGQKPRSSNKKIILATGLGLFVVLVAVAGTLLLKKDVVETKEIDKVGDVVSEVNKKVENKVVNVTTAATNTTLYKNAQFGYSVMVPNDWKRFGTDEERVKFNSTDDKLQLNITILPASPELLVHEDPNSPSDSYWEQWLRMRQAKEGNIYAFLEMEGKKIRNLNLDSCESVEVLAFDEEESASYYTVCWGKKYFVGVQLKSKISDVDILVKTLGIHDEILASFKFNELVVN